MKLLCCLIYFVGMLNFGMLVVGIDVSKSRRNVPSYCEIRSLASLSKKSGASYCI
jgi:hypothetical protein